VVDVSDLGLHRRYIATATRRSIASAFVMFSGKGNDVESKE